MRIAQVAPLIESVPPKHYGGTERIVSYLTEELVRAGHEVTLFASGDSVTKARLIAPFERSVCKNDRCKDPMARELVLIDHVVAHARRSLSFCRCAYNIVAWQSVSRSLEQAFPV